MGWRDALEGLAAAGQVRGNAPEEVEADGHAEKHSILEFRSTRCVPQIQHFRRADGKVRPVAAVAVAVPTLPPNRNGRRFARENGHW